MSTRHAQGLDLQVSVNIGALHLQQEDFPHRLCGLLQKHPYVVPHLLQLEVLETHAMQDIDKVTAVMRACHVLGVVFVADAAPSASSKITK